MSDTVIKVENVSKLYRLGETGTGTIGQDINRWFAKMRGKEDPFAMVGKINDRNVKSTCDIVWALKDINFEVKQGEVLGIIGRNGAGKSTLLKILSKVTAPSKGRIRVKGRIASLLEVGTGFHPDLTGRENVFLNGAILGMTKAEINKKFDEIIDFAGVERYIDTPVKRYSSGMYVRLAFAVAAFLEPEILILDEVLAVGDAEFQKKCLGRMKDVSNNDGRTVLFVSHNMTSIKALCIRSIILSNGKLFYNDLTKKAITKYNELNTLPSTNKLSERADRSGNGQLKVIDFSVNGLSSEADICNTEKLLFEVSYETNISKFFGKILIGVYDLLGVPIFFLDSHCIKDMPNIFPSKGKIDIKIENEFALAPGKYTINIALFTNNEMADYIQGAFSFNIIEDDYFGTGRLPSGQYTIVPKQLWNISSM